MVRLEVVAAIVQGRNPRFVVILSLNGLELLRFQRSLAAGFAGTTPDSMFFDRP